MKDSFQAFDVVRATFRPAKTDDLKPGVVEWFGWAGLWQCEGECPSGGPYAGQSRWSVDLREYGDSSFRPPFSWTPFCDLEIHAVVERFGGRE